MNITNIPIYKKYKRGTYKSLTTEERMFYVNLIKEADEKCSQDYNIINFTPMGKWNDLPKDYDEIEKNIYDFFSDASKHIISKLNSKHIYNICPDFTIDYDWMTQKISWISYNSKNDTLYISMEYDQSADTLEFDYRFLDENYLDNFI